jgi:hypothetical protein
MATGVHGRTNGARLSTREATTAASSGRAASAFSRYCPCGENVPPSSFFSFFKKEIFYKSYNDEWLGGENTGECRLF